MGSVTIDEPLEAQPAFPSSPSSASLSAQAVFIIGEGQTQGHTEGHGQFGATFERAVSTGSSSGHQSEGTGRKFSLTSTSNIARKIRRSTSIYHGSTLEQKFTELQKKAMLGFSSVNYMPTYSQVYIRWVSNHSEKFAAFCSSYDRWLLSLLIGLLTGMTTVLLKQSFQALGNIRWGQSKSYIQEDNMWDAWGWNFGFAALYALISSFLIAFIHPLAAGGGTAEVIAFLNGITVHGCFSFKFIIIKILSNIFSVASGMPAAIQGPVIAVGAAIGAGIGKLESKTFNCNPSIFESLKTAEERRTFTTLGVAAGVAAAFDAPVGGLMFAMEDLSSHWTKRVGWQTFFCAVIATLVASIFNSAFTAYIYQGNFGSLTLELVLPIQIYVGILIPAIMFGILGGLGGALFTMTNLYLGRFRALWVSKLKYPTLQKIAKMGECVLIVAFMSSFTVWLPLAFPCQEYTAAEQNVLPFETCYLERTNTTSVIPLQSYSCVAKANQSNVIQTFNGAATLIQGPASYINSNLWSRGTYFAFTWQQLLAVLPIWFFATTYTLGSAISGGIFVPVLIIGGLYGRLTGLGLIAMYQHFSGESFPTDSRFTWLDPGVLAVVGAGSMLGGVTRLAIASTVIVTEMCHDINLTIPTAIAIMVAKSLADFICKPLFKHQLDKKSLPVLEQEPRVPVDGLAVNLELYKARDIMTKHPQTIHHVESVHKLASLILSTNHSGYPIVRYDEETRSELLCGFITRKELEVLLASNDVYNEDEPGKVIYPNVPYSEVSIDYNPNKSAVIERLRSYVKFAVYHNLYIELQQYMSLSVHKVDEDFSLHRTYRLFRTLGLCHLVVTDIRNRVVGIITRKDMIPYTMSLRLSRVTDPLKDCYVPENDSGVFPSSPLPRSPRGSLTPEPIYARPASFHDLRARRSSQELQPVREEESPATLAGRRGFTKSLQSLETEVENYIDTSL